MTRVKICGLTRAEDVELAVALGASAVGFVLEPSSPRFVGLADVSRLLELVPPYVSRVAVMGPFQAGGHLAPFDAVQAIGVRSSMLEPGQRAIAVFRPGSEDEPVDQSDVDAVLLDGHAPGSFGGTGTTVDLALARAAIAECVRPVVLAGGLTPDNVGRLIAELRPFAVDVSSGVESEPGKKDASAMRAFFDAVRDAAGTLGP